MVWVCSLCQSFLKCKVAKRATHSFSSGKKSHILWWITFCKDEKLLAFVKRLFSREKKSCNNFTPYFSKVPNKHSKIDGKVTKTRIFFLFCVQLLVLKQNMCSTISQILLRLIQERWAKDESWDDTKGKL